MRKKDYELIGSAFRYGDTIPANEHQLYWVADFLANKLQRNYPKFDRQKFLTACGIEADVRTAELRPESFNNKGCIHLSAHYNDAGSMVCNSCDTVLR